ncbi:MAG: type 4a pilus biogenesis protein PilO [Candidatus Levybacteria bacterium]|nr:type 4a pilus biogenesis protein PilO [Candidatus Levybacteria bacterium]
MNLKENLLNTIPKKTYLAYLKMQLRVRGEKTKDYSFIILTLFALSFFGLFVINPTISTITAIRKQLIDAKLLNEKLEKKIQVLDKLASQYNRLKNDTPFVLAAVPTEPEALPLLGKIVTIAQESNLTTSRLEVSKVELTKSEEKNRQGSFVFSVRVRGIYADLEHFLSRAILLDRIITIEQVSILREESAVSLFDENTRILQIKGRAYFKT